VCSVIDNWCGGGGVPVSLANLFQDLKTGLKNSAFCQQNGSHSDGMRDIFVFCTFGGLTGPRGLRGRYSLDGLRGEVSDFKAGLPSKYRGQLLQAVL
jgi:hypothetical protein